MVSLSNGTSRIEKWDSLKGLLIFLVVIGHSYLTSLNQAESTRGLYFFIYLFHMPLFMFISGLFSRKSVETGIGLKRKVVGYVILAFFLKFAVIGVKILLGGFRAFHMWSESGVPWYLFALAGYMALTWFLRGIPRKVLLGFAVVFACFAGYDFDVGDLLITSRFIVSYPFFLMGVCWDPAVVEPKDGNRWLWKAGAVVLLGGTLWLVFRNIGFLYPYVDLIKGGSSYIEMKNSIGKDMMLWGALLRLTHYAAAALLSAALVILMPSGKTPFTWIGKRTLQIYFWHRPFQKVLELVGFVAFLEGAVPEHWRMVYLLCNVLLTIFLSAEVFGRPFVWFWKQLEKV